MLSPPALPYYPWYAPVSGDEIQQGDIIDACPVFSPRIADVDESNSPCQFDWAEHDVIVMSQSCDLVKGCEKAKSVVICPLWRFSALAGSHVSKPKGFEECRRGSLPALHLLGESTVSGFERELRIVDFHQIWSLPVAFVRQRLARLIHLRLLPPYREHLSQAFARYFMRVGLPEGIPPLPVNTKPGPFQTTKL